MKRTWRYYRNMLLYYLSLGLLVVAAARALREPVYWAATAGLLVLHQAVRIAFGAAHPMRRPTREDPYAEGFRTLEYDGSDGVKMFARFAPSHNHGTIILVHGRGESAKDLAVLARLLMREGYGVFLPDLRAHGSSGGDTSTLGIREGKDIACAVEFLLKRIDVDGEKIGGYGTRLGAHAILRAALETGKIKALVLEEIGPSGMRDIRLSMKSLAYWTGLPVNWLSYVIYRFMAGVKTENALEMMGRMPPRPTLLIVTGEARRPLTRLLHEAAVEPKEIWELPDETHGGAIVQDPHEYMERMKSFFDRSLNIQGGTR